MKKEQYESIIDECSKEYKMILKEYIDNNTLKSAIELIKLDNYVKKNLMNYNTKSAIIPLLIVEVYTIFLIFLLLMVNQNFTDSIYVIIYLMLSMSIIQVFNIFSSVNKRRKNVKAVNYIEYDVVRKWRRIVGLANDLKLQNQKKYIADIATIEYLFEEKFINVIEVEYLKILLKERNRIVHYKDVVSDQKDLEIVLEKVEKIIKRLENMINK